MSSLKHLKEKFTKVIIKYTNKSCEVMLVDGLNIFIGKSRCHENDNFDRKKGRTIALGRAEFAYKVDSGEKLARNSKCFISTHGVQEVGCRYNSFNYTDVIEVDEHIISFLPTRQPQKAS